MITIFTCADKQSIVPAEAYDKLRSWIQDDKIIIWGQKVEIDYVAENLEELKAITDYNNSKKPHIEYLESELLETSGPCCCGVRD